MSAGAAVAALLIGMGAGWGGPAKGAGTKDLNRGGAHRTREAIANKAAEAEKMLAIIADIARDEEALPQTRVMAAATVLDRIEGKAVQRSITATADDLARLSDDDLRRELARFGGAEVEDTAGNSTPCLPN